MNNNKMNYALILAAGASERFGSCKYTEKIKNIPLIFWSLRPFLKIFFSHNLCIIIVAGPHYEKILEMLQDKKDPFYGYNIKVIEQDNKANLIYENPPKKYKCSKNFSNQKIVEIFLCKNENYQKGMFTSVKKGIETILEIYKNLDSKKNIKKNIGAVVISLADMPLITPDTILNLVKRLKSKFTDCVIPYTILKQEISQKNEINLPKEYEFKTKKGHPIALKIGFALKFLKFDDNIILRDVLKFGKVKFLKTNGIGILFDIDKFEDLEKLNNFNF